jgi:hypothetical protein
MPEFRQEPRGKGLDESKTVAALGLKDILRAASQPMSQVSQ